MNEKKRNFNLYAIVAFSLAVLVPLPGRFAYGIIFFVAINFFMFAGTLFKKLISELDMEEMQPLALALILIACAVFIKELLKLYSPLIALTLGFSLYMTALSSFMIGSLYDKEKTVLANDLKINMKRSVLYSLLALSYFFVRDFFGYGTITLPSRSGFYYINVFPKQTEYFSVSSFFASIPGALLLTVLMISLFTFIDKKISATKSKKTERIEEKKVEDKKTEGFHSEQTPVSEKNQAQEIKSETVGEAEIENTENTLQPQASISEEKTEEQNDENTDEIGPLENKENLSNEETSVQKSQNDEDAFAEQENFEEAGQTADLSLQEENKNLNGENENA